MKPISTANLSKYCAMLIVLTILAILPANAQITTKGKDFWFAFMENFDETNLTLKVFISSENNATGVIRIPQHNWSQDFTVTANQSTIIDIPNNVGHSKGKGAQKTAINVTSDVEVNVFAMNYRKTSSDGTLVLPTNALGNSYYIISYNPFIGADSEFLIVAVEDNTRIDIVAPSGSKSTITLNKGDAHQFQSDVDYTGYYVNSSLYGGKPFAVFSGNKCTKIPPSQVACDHIVEQLFPVRSWRRTFVTVPLRTRDGDTYRILASRNNTEVKINGTTVTSLNAGQHYELILKGASIISSTYPICVAQYSNGQEYDAAVADPFMIILSPVDQTRHDITFHVFDFPNISNNYLNVVAKTSCIGSLRLDGAVISSAFTPVPFDPSYSFARISIADGSHRLVANEDCGFNAYVYGFGDYDSYGYSAGTSLDTLSIGLVVNTNCAGTPTEFFVKSRPYTIINYKWDFGDGSTSTLEKPKHTYSAGGVYEVELIVTYDDNQKDTVNQTFVITEPKAKIFHHGGGCGNFKLQFTNMSTVVGGVINYTEWDFGDGNRSYQDNPDHIYSQTGEYQVVLMLRTTNGCTSYDTAKVSIYAMPKLNVGADVEICLNSSTEIGNIATNGTEPYSYSWYPSQGLDAFNKAKVIASPTVTTTYYVTVTDKNGCKASDTIIVTVNALPVANAGPDKNICYGTSTNIGMTATGGTPPYVSYQWSPATGLSATNTSVVEASPLDSTMYVLTVTDSKGCVDTDTVWVNVWPLPKPIIKPLGPTWFCSCDSVMLDAENFGYTNYLWSTGQTTRMITVRDPGDYTVTVTDTNGCVNTSPPQSIEVTYPNALISLPTGTLSANTGEKLSVPLFIKHSEHLDTCKAFQYRAKIRLKRSCLVPMDANNKGNIIDEDRTLTVNGMRKKGDSVLMVLDFMTVLGKTSHTSLEIIEFQWLDCPFYVDTSGSYFQVSNICLAGDKERLFFEVENLIQVMPNPVREHTEIIYKVAEDGISKLFVVDVLGRTVDTILEHYHDAGFYHIIYSTDKITSGVYFLVLQSPTKIVSKIVEVQK